MRKSIFKAMALGAFVLAGGAAVAHGKMVDGKIWVYTPLAGGGTTTAVEPNCNSETADECAVEHFLNPDNSIGAPTGQVRYGARN